MRALTSSRVFCTAARSIALGGFFNMAQPCNSSSHDSCPSPSLSSMENTLLMSDRSKPIALSHSSTFLLSNTFWSSCWSTSPLPSSSALRKNSVSLIFSAFAALLTSFNMMLSSRAATLNVSFKNTPEMTSITAKPKTSWWQMPNSMRTSLNPVSTRVIVYQLPSSISIIVSNDLVKVPKYENSSCLSSRSKLSSSQYLLMSRLSTTANIISPNSKTHMDHPTAETLPLIDCNIKYSEAKPLIVFTNRSTRTSLNKRINVGGNGRSFESDSIQKKTTTRTSITVHASFRVFFGTATNLSTSSAVNKSP
mmetsp:Transcript_71772/g.194105  ORF Transcript_71772/g.194105 Transcript_71772/m.194105 type:complete len:308 (+) Transcript_71772:74-997(+)